MPRHIPTLDDNEYAAFVACDSTSDGRYIGRLKVIRKSDKRILFPFDGAPVIGPFEEQDDARRAATDLARRLIEADRAMPEP
jgi:hypothetical protein